VRVARIGPQIASIEVDDRRARERRELGFDVDIAAAKIATRMSPRRPEELVRTNVERRSWCR
jgi:hypothetical protein